MKIKKFASIFALLTGLLVLAACQPQTVEVIKEVPVEVEKIVEVEKEVVKEVEVIKEVEVEKIVEVEVEAMAEEPDAVPYNLTPGKPYDGTTVNFLICCPTAGQFAAWQKSVDEFTELTGISVEFANEPWGSFQERIVTESIAGTGAFDAVVWPDSWGPSFSNTLQPLEPLIERDGIDYMDDYPPAFLEAGTFNDHIYGIPVRTHAFVTFYRQDVFDDLGLEAPTTWTEVLEAGRTIQAETDMAGLSNYYGVGSAQNLFVYALMLWGNGGDIFDDNYRPTFNSQAGVDAANLYASLAEIGPEAQFNNNEADARGSVQQGESAMIVGWWHFAGGFSNPEVSVEGVVGNMQHAALPAVEGKDPTGFALSIPVGISSFSRNQDAAWEWIKFISHPARDKAVVMDKSDPATNTVVASHTSVITDPEVNEVNGGIHAAAAPGLENSRLMPLIPEWAEVSSIMETAINEIVLGADAQSTLDEAAADVEAVMERSGYYKDQ